MVEAVPDAAVVVDAGQDAGVVIVDAGPPVPAELVFTVEVLGVDGGLQTVESSVARAEIDSSKSLVVTFATPLKDYRVRLLDGSDQVLPSDEEARVEDGGIRYQITLASPLKPARTYTFAIDAQFGHEITDVVGREYRDVNLALKIRGEPEPDPKAAKKRRHR